MMQDVFSGSMGIIDGMENREFDEFDYRGDIPSREMMDQINQYNESPELEEYQPPTR